MMRSVLIGLTVIGIVIVFLVSLGTIKLPQNVKLPISTDESLTENLGGIVGNLHPLSIESLRKSEFPGSDLIIEQELDPGSNYRRFIASYKSEGLKQFGLLTVPLGEKPASGWPVIIFNHGFIPPHEYRTTERYVAYVDGFARNGYVVFRPDCRGHGNSDGEAQGGYGSNDYTIDVLNAVSSIKKLKSSSFWGAEATPESDPGQVEDAQRGARMTESIVDPNRIGMWGHSMGGFITLRSMVVTDDIKAGVIWGGVVASYPDLITSWRRGNRTVTPTPRPNNPRRWRDALVEEFGQPSNDEPFWQSISANFFLKDISGPLQLHHTEGDVSVPYEFSATLEKQMKEAGKTVEYFQYPGDDHDITLNFGIAMQRSIEFFDKHLKLANSK